MNVISDSPYLLGGQNLPAQTRCEHSSGTASHSHSVVSVFVSSRLLHADTDTETPAVRHSTVQNITFTLSHPQHSFRIYKTMLISA